ncbi:hypothetical protein GJ496_006236 [Pomphorhynchus laevis]|nr:hypothetical protein GJ496_006236 [Pomphorhynchus laevis]
MRVRKLRGDPIRKPGALHKHIEKNDDPIKRKIKRKKKEFAVDDSRLDNVLTAKESQRILQMARRQQDEMGVSDDDDIHQEYDPILFQVNKTSGHDDRTETHGIQLLCKSEKTGQDKMVSFTDDQEIKVDENDEKILELFMSKNPFQRRTLADLIQEKLDEKKQNLSRAAGNECLQKRIDSDIVKLYKDVGKVLSHYRSGKLPKAFKALPALENWEALVVFTHPESWTAASMFQATRIFASKLNNQLAEKFYHSILLPRIRDDIAAYKRLNQHLTMAVRKATIKPAAFFKGIIFPLCTSGDCTLRESVILGSIISRCSIPVLHCGAALYKLSSLEYSGGTSLFIKTLLDKRYALHYRVVDILVEHFVRFRDETRVLPVIWQQSLLSFAEGYHRDLNSKQTEALLDLINYQKHHQISIVIKEILNSDSNKVSLSEHDHDVAMT